MYHSTKYSQDNSNEAPLKALTTTAPMTAQQHSALCQKRMEQRRAIEMAKERKKAAEENPWW
ncbi:hypothetical protein D3878_04805 [Noviherbaspirillum sedimenti]|uniref:Uncharacterized protein n=1 Tax=Noviherbaspirillum sedimenti TaxID=2320865 RepID=A0A3A3G3C7_9BURK|nr:hypothetical protein D3878_04805 [Noviherbaspirillum sedimenti]